MNNDPIRLNRKSKSIAQVANKDTSNDDVYEVANQNPTVVPTITEKRPPRRRGEKDKLQSGGDGVVFQITVEVIIANKSKLEEAKKLEKDLSGLR